MIEFNQDGPFAEKADHLFPDRVRLVGLGQAGVAVCDQLMMHGRPAQDLWVLDSDQLIIEGSVVPNRHLLGRNLVHGMGCSGDLVLAREIAAIEENLLAQVARGCDFLILILGLAGSTGVALAERLAEMGRAAGARVIVVGVQPFSFEGSTRREKSIEAIANLRQEADSVLVLSNDRLSDNPETLKNIRHGFHLMNQLLAKTAQALAQVVCKRGLIQLSFADVRSLYGRYAGSEVLENCWVAHVEGTLRDCTDELIIELLGGPLLANEGIWKYVDHAIVTISGTRSLGLSDVQEIVGALKDRMPANIPIATSASLDDESHDKVRVSLLLAMTAPVPLGVEEIAAPPKHTLPPRKTAAAETVPLPAKAELEPPITEPVPQKTKITRPAKTPKLKPVLEENHSAVEDPLPLSIPEETETVPLPIAAVVPSSNRTMRRFKAKQEEMQFEAPTRGRFEKTHETLYNGENLDQPTFRRRGLKIRI